MADRDEELLALAEAIRKFISLSKYEKIEFAMTRSMAETLADRIEEWCKHGEKDAANI